MSQQLAEALHWSPRRTHPYFFWYLPKTQNSIVVEVNYHRCQGTQTQSAPAQQPAHSNSIWISQSQRCLVESGRVSVAFRKLQRFAPCYKHRTTCLTGRQKMEHSRSSGLLAVCFADEKCLATGKWSYRGLVKHQFFKDQAISAKRWIPNKSRYYYYIILLTTSNNILQDTQAQRGASSKGIRFSSST